MNRNYARLDVRAKNCCKKKCRSNNELRPKSALDSKGQCASKGLPERKGLSASRLIDIIHGCEYMLTYEDKDVDMMLVGDVPAYIRDQGDLALL
ncbi:uncharacterized protein LOC141672981 isoform X2 [Apium graveolens]|uniref:uncharacterized protein LOC141672981 isoform X2 n=1 Tax=Apium graveolens TaxID=4045 RepID=UPI003D799E09